MLQISKKKKRKNPKRTSIHSTMTAGAQRALHGLAAALVAQGGRVAAGLEARLATVLEEGEEMPDLRLLLRLFERLLGGTARELDASDADAWKKAMKLRALRFECATVKKEVHVAAVKIRKALVELVGSKHCRFHFGLSPRTPRGAADLAIEVRRLVSRLAGPRSGAPRSGAPGLRLPVSLLPGLEADPEGWVAELTPPLERLEVLLQEIEVHRIATSDGVIARRKALDASAETGRLVMDASQALFALAGENELARRLRPRRRRRRKAAKPQRQRLRAAAVTRMAGPLFERLRRLLGRLTAAASAALGRRLPDVAVRLARRRPLTT